MVSLFHRSMDFEQPTDSTCIQPKYAATIHRTSTPSLLAPNYPLLSSRLSITQSSSTPIPSTSILKSSTSTSNESSPPSRGKSRKRLAKGRPTTTMETTAQLRREISSVFKRSVGESTMVSRPPFSLHLRCLAIQYGPLTRRNDDQECSSPNQNSEIIQPISSRISSAQIHPPSKRSSRNLQSKQLSSFDLRRKRNGTARNWVPPERLSMGILRY